MKRYKVFSGRLVEAQDGGLVDYIDMIHYQITIQDRHLAIVRQYQETIDALKAELLKEL